jgi:tRNA(Leu) C34 or U34 (ribose-2'-O)-methylase TrmL
MTAGVALIDPKYARNVGTAVRAASCYGIPEISVTGNRVALVGDHAPKTSRSRRAATYRLPREERMRDGRCVRVTRTTKPIDDYPGLIPVAVELVPGAELLPFFEHPEHALYVFGPEDGDIPSGVLSACHRFVKIPQLHCSNLSSTVYMILMDRHHKRVLAGIEEPLQLASEGRWEFEDVEGTLAP